MKIKNILFLMIAMLAFVSCSDDDEPAIPQYQPSVLTHPTDGTSYELLQKDKTKEAFALSWTSYKQSELALAPPVYAIQVDTVGSNFSKAQTILSVSEVSDATAATVYNASVTVEQLNSALTTGLHLTPEKEYNIEIRVITQIASGLIKTSASNVFTAKAIPYEVVALPDPIHLIGSMFGENSWNEHNYTFVMFRASNDEVNTYTGKFAAGSEFKFIPNANLGTWALSYGVGASAGTLTSDNAGNITDIKTAGYYTVTADISALKYTVTAYDASAAKEYGDIELIGAFNNWSDAGTIKLTKSSYDPHIWVADDVNITAGEIKFRADAGWAVSWGGDSFPYGGGSGNNIAAEDGKYFIKFNYLTGQYVFLSK